MEQLCFVYGYQDRELLAKRDFFRTMVGQARGRAFADGLRKPGDDSSADLTLRPMYIEDMNSDGVMRPAHLADRVRTLVSLLKPTLRDPREYAILQLLLLLDDGGDPEAVGLDDRDEARQVQEAHKAYLALLLR